MDEARVTTEPYVIKASEWRNFAYLLKLRQFAWLEVLLLAVAAYSWIRGAPVWFVIGTPIYGFLVILLVEEVRFQQSKKEVLTETQVWFTDQGYGAETATGVRTEVPWTLVKKVFDFGPFLAIKLNRGTVLIPRSAFRDTAGYEKLLSWVRELGLRK